MDDVLRLTAAFTIREGAVLGSANMQGPSSLVDNYGGISTAKQLLFLA